MRIQILEMFARTVTALPAECIVKVLDLQCRMLKDDAANNRLPLPADAFSIFYFTEFVHAAKAGQTLNSHRLLPPDHLEFFKETIVRLVQANQLPQSAMAQFDHAFMSDTRS